MNCVFQHLCLLEDLGQNILEAKERGRYVCHINRLIELTYLGFEYALVFGDYFSSARSLRWIYETCLAGYAASKDGKILTGKQSDLGYLNIVKFEKWMRALDEGRVRFNSSTRERILTILGLSQEEKRRCMRLYGDLCKYAHVSNVSLRRGALVPNLTLDMREFSRVYRMSNRTMDLCMFAILKSYGTIDDIGGFLENYRSWFYPGKSHTRLFASEFPITRGFVYGRR